MASQVFGNADSGNGFVAWSHQAIDWTNINTLRLRQDGRHFADDIFTCIFFNENCYVLMKFLLKYVRKGPIDNKPALVQIMAWRRSGDKPLSEPMMISLPTHTCVTRPQWFNIPSNWVPWYLPKGNFKWNGSRYQSLKCWNQRQVSHCV